MAGSTIADGIYKAMSRIRAKLGGTRKLVSIFVLFLSTSAKFLFLEETMGARLCFHPFFRFFYKVLSRSATREVTRIQCFVFQISCTTLLVVNRNYTKTLKCFIILCLRLKVLYQITCLSKGTFESCQNLDQFTSAAMFLLTDNSKFTYIQVKNVFISRPVAMYQIQLRSVFNNNPTLSGSQKTLHMGQTKFFFLILSKFDRID